MVASYSNQVAKAVNYMLKRLGTTAVYKRMQSPGEYSLSGVTQIWWEWPSITAITYDCHVRDVEESGGRLQLGDKAFAFLNSVFTSHTSYEYIKFTSGSAEFTAGETITGATDGATAVVIDWYEDDGTWVGGDSVGVVWVSTIVGTFNASENLNGSIGGVNMATTTATNTSGGTDSNEPNIGDEIVYGGVTYTIEIASVDKELRQESVIREDVTQTTTTVWTRKVENG